MMYNRLIRWVFDRLLRLVFKQAGLPNPMRVPMKVRKPKYRNTRSTRSISSKSRTTYMGEVESILDKTLR